MDIEIDFQDASIRTLKQELFIVKSILQKVHLLGRDNEIKIILTELNSKHLPIEAQHGFDETQLAIVISIFKLLENQRCITGLHYDEKAKAKTSFFLLPAVEELKYFRHRLLKELRVRGEILDEHFQFEFILINDKLKYEVDNNEIQFSDNESMKLEADSAYGRLLILLISNLGIRQGYKEICDAVKINYEGVDPDTDSSIKREVQLIKDDLVSRLLKAGMTSEQINKMIVARDGYKMNKMN